MSGALRTAWRGVLVALAFGPEALAHDFWVQPAAFWVGAGMQTPLTLQVGHGSDRRRSAIPLDRITRFEAIAPGGAATDLRPFLSLGGPEADGVVGPGAAGVHVLALETDSRARSHLPADRFNAYAQEEGLSPALDQRRRAGRTGADASERYSRVAKSLVRVGDPGAASHDAATRAVGLTLELVPLVSPYAAPRPASLPVRVLYEGEPLAGALVKLTDLDDDTAPLETRRTGTEGLADFTLPTGGRWRLNVVWTRPLAGSEDADFETIFSSLSFGFPAEAGDGTRTASAHRPPGTPR